MKNFYLTKASKMIFSWKEITVKPVEVGRTYWVLQFFISIQAFILNWVIEFATTHTWSDLQLIFLDRKIFKGTRIELRLLCLVTVQVRSETRLLCLTTVQGLFICGIKWTCNNFYFHNSKGTFVDHMGPLWRYRRWPDFCPRKLCSICNIS